jgi:hypothetical protein
VNVRCEFEFELVSPLGFIAGVKMMLSSDAKRTDSKQCEEVNIPVSEPAQVSVGDKLVPISSLDEVMSSFIAFFEPLGQLCIF